MGGVVTKLNSNSSNDQIQIGKVDSLADVYVVKSEVANNLEEAVITVSDEDMVESMEADRPSSPGLSAHKLKKCEVMVNKVKLNITSQNVNKSNSNKGSIESSFSFFRSSSIFFEVIFHFFLRWSF